MKKIVFLMPTVFTHGGEQRTVTNLCNSLITNGYQVSLILFDKTCKIDYSLYNLSQNVDIYFTNNYNSFSKRLCRKLRNINSRVGFLKYLNFINRALMKNSFPISEVLKIINNISPDYVIGVASDFNILCYFLKKKINNVKFIGWQHSCFKAYFETKGRRHYYEKKLAIKMYRFLDEYIVLTKNDKRLLKEHFDFDSKYIYNMKSFSSSIKSDLRKHSIISAGRMDYIKGFDLLLDAFYLFNKSNPNNDWKLDIFGDGEEKEKLIDKIRYYNLDDKVFLHPFTNNIIEEYKKHSIYIMPSRWEGFPLTIGECFEMNLPMICFDIDVVKEFIINNIDGIIVKSFDTKKLSNAITILSSNYNLRKKISTNEGKKVEVLNEKNVVKKWIEILK